MNSNDIIEQLKQVLPAYMIPARFVQIHEIPLTSNGKMDRLALTNLKGKQLSTGDSYVAPRNAIEKRLVEMWEEILERDKIGVQDDFFALGGHSLTVIRLISKIQAEYDSKFEIAKLFEQNTIEKIAELITIVPNFTPQSDEDMETYKV
jgi:acyl carrier protein